MKVKEQLFDVESKWDKAKPTKNLGEFRIDNAGKLIFHKYGLKEKFIPGAGMVIGVLLGIAGVVFCPILGVIPAAMIITEIFRKETKQ